MLLKYFYSFLIFLLYSCLFAENSFGQVNCAAAISPVGTASYCPGGSVPLSANIGTNLRYQWFRNEEPLSTGPTTAATYIASQPGSYKVKVTSTGCTGAFSEAVEVTENIPPSSPDFSISSLAPQCSGTPITLSVLSPNSGYTYRWDFGDGTTGIGTSIVHSFFSENLTGQDFIIRLMTTDQNGCSSLQEKTITVKPGPVIKLINIQNFTNCKGGDFNLSANDASEVSEGINYEYIIDWGDNKPLYKSGVPPVNVNHTYSPGIYTLKYTIKSTSECTVTKEYTIENRSTPSVSAIPLQGTIQCIPFNFSFEILGYAANHPSTNYLVDYGDGTTKLYKHSELPRIVTHNYTTSSCGTASGFYEFKITPITNCESPPAIKIPLKLNPQTPQANFSLVNQDACLNIPTPFSNLTAEGKVFECNKNTVYTWIWGDGTPNTVTTSRTNPAHTYKQIGTYTVTLKVDNVCNSSTFSKEVVVISPPKAAFTTTTEPTTACIDATVRTTNNSTGDKLMYGWTVRPSTGYVLAPGSTLTSKEPAFIFSNPGTYRILLTASNNCKNDTTSQKIIFKGLPTAKLPVNKTYCGPQNITFGPNTDHTPVYEANNGTITTYNWEVSGGAFNFTNSTSANSPYPVIHLSEAGIYTVKVFATSECGNSAVATQTITINPIPVVADIPTQNICSGTKATFTLPEINGIYKWYASPDATTPLSTGILNATGRIFETGNLTANQTYYVEITSPEGCVSGSRKAAQVVTTPVITNNIISTTKTTYCSGSLIGTLIGEAGLAGGGAIRFEWEQSTDNGATYTTIEEATQSNYTPSEPLTKTTWFRRNVISGVCASSTSNIIKIVIEQPITNNIISQAQTICAGSTPAPLAGRLPQDGNKNYAYQWQSKTLNGSFQNIASTSANLNINGRGQNYTPGPLNTTTWFRRIVTAGECMVSESNIIEITVNPLPAIPVAPTPAPICANTIIQLTATATTGSLEWYTAVSGGSKITAGVNEDGSEFTTPALKQTTTYYVQAVSNGCASARVAVTVTVRPLPVVTASPASQDICNNGTTNIQLSSDKAGTTFSWQPMSSSVTGPASGSGSVIAQKLTNSGTTPATITYVVTPSLNGCAGAPILVNITVNPNLDNNIILTPPLTICAGTQPAKLQGSVPNGGSAGKIYRWEISLTGEPGSYGAAPGGTEKDYQPGTLTDNTWFRRTITSGGCSSTSDPIKITVIPAIQNYSILSGNQLKCSGAQPDKIIGEQPTKGTGTYAYSWEISINNGITYTVITDAIAKDYTPAPVTQLTWFRRLVTSGSCQVISNAVRIDIEQPIEENIISASQIICAQTTPAPLAGSLPKGGNERYVYQWQSSPDGEHFTNITTNGQVKDYAPGILKTTGPVWYRRLVTAGVCATVVSNIIKITVNPAITNNTISSAPEVICTGTAPKTITALLPAGGDSDPVYEWEMSTTSATAGFTAAPNLNTTQNYTSGILAETSWFRRKVTSGGCTHISLPIQITVNELITNNRILSEPLTICTGSSTTLSGSTPSGGNNSPQYTWQISTDGTTGVFRDAPGVNNQVNYTTPNLTQATWFRRVVKAGPCSADISLAIQVEVDEPITENIITEAQAICAGAEAAPLMGSIPVGGNGRYEYIWESSITSATTGFKAATGNNITQSYSPGILNKTTWFRRKAVSAPCNPVFSNVIAITVTPPIVNIITTKNQEICSGTAASIIQAENPAGGNGRFEITWESSIDNNIYGAAIGSNKSASYNPGVLIQTTWFRRKVSSGACTVWSDPVIVTANPAINKNTIDGAQDLCASSTADGIYGSIPAGGNGQYTYLWESSADNKTFVPAKGINNLRDYQPGETLKTTWFRRMVSAGTCAPSFSEVVRISVTPGVSNNSIGVAQRICVGTSAAPLLGTEAKGGDGQLTYLWEVSTISSAAGFVTASGTANTKDYQPGSLTQTSWFRRIIISGGCSSTSRPVQITVDINISNNIIANAQTICIQTTPKALIGSLPAGGSQKYTYEWEFSTDGIRYYPAPGINNQKDYQPAALTKSTWFRRVVLSAPCGASESNNIMITVDPLITDNIIQTNQLICSGATPASITGKTPKGGSGNYTYLWEVSSGNNGVFSSAPGINNQPDYAPSALSQTSIFRRTVSSGPCQNSVSNYVAIQVKALPNAPVVQAVRTCKDTPATLTASGPADNFAWYTTASGGTPVFTGKSFQTPALTVPATYYVEAITAGCTSQRVPVKVELFEAAAAAGNDVTITKGQHIMLKATGGTSYKWSPATGLSDENIQSPLARPQETTTYKVTVKTVDGCTSSDEVTVTVIPKILVTNGFTPNHDGFNDTWVIKNIEYYPEAQIEIFNRWGSKIFSSAGYAKPWDGTLNGQELPVAAYYYIIKLNDKEAPISGSITLIR